MQFILTQCAVLGIALGAGDPPPLASYNFGITGEPMKDDTAFGNLGELGPVYNVPEARKDSSATRGRNPQFGKPTTTEPPTIVQSTTVAPTGKLINSSKVEEITTIKTTDSDKITLPGQGSALNGSKSEEESSETSKISSPTQTSGTTTISKEQGTTITTESGYNATSNSSNTNVTTAATTIPGGSSNPSSPPPSTTSYTSSSTPSPTTQGATKPTTPNGPPSQTFHTGSPNSTDAPTIPPSAGDNETKPARNSTIPSKPNSSMSLYPNNGNIWLTLAAASLYIVNIKHT